MTDAGDANDEGQRGPVTLDLTADRAYDVVVHALGKYARDARERAEHHAYSEESNPVKALDAFELADVADDLREQIENQIDTLSAPQEKSE